MTDEQYQATQDVMVNLYQQLSIFDLDLGGFLDRIRRAETVCPILDPTLWIRGSGNLEVVKRMAEALLPAVRLVREMKEDLKIGQHRACNDARRDRADPG